MWSGTDTWPLSTHIQLRDPASKYLACKTQHFIQWYSPFFKNILHIYSELYVTSFFGTSIVIASIHFFFRANLVFSATRNHSACNSLNKPCIEIVNLTWRQFPWQSSEMLWVTGTFIHSAETLSTSSGRHCSRLWGYSKTDSSPINHI